MFSQILILSDIHLGHSTNKTEDIINNLNMFFKDYDKEIRMLDLIIVSGDVYDKLLSSNSREIGMINNWLTRLLMKCVDYSISIRFLEGTPGHEWKQLSILDNIVKELKIKNLDYRYYKELSYEHMLTTNLKIIYIPDEWRENALQTYNEVLELIKKHGKPDLIIMHGAFHYQIPYKKSSAFHDEDLYTKLVKYNVIAGHVHNHSRYKKIIVPGSFDSLTHIDTNTKKGGILLTLDNGKSTMKFLENKRALKFFTIDVSDMDLLKIEKILNKYNDRKEKIHVRLLNKNPDNKILTNSKELESKYNFLVITTTTKLDEEENIDLRQNKIIKDGIKLNKDNIKKLLIKELIEKKVEITDLVKKEVDDNLKI